MNINKKAPEIEGNNKSTVSSLAQWEQLCKQAYDEICEVCENGSLRDLINLESEIRSEKTNNKRDLLKIKRAINERYGYV